MTGGKFQEGKRESSDSYKSKEDPRTENDKKLLSPIPCSIVHSDTVHLSLAESPVHLILINESTKFTKLLKNQEKHSVCAFVLICARANC